MDLKEYFTMAGCSEQYESLSEEEKTQLDLFELLTANAQTLALLQDMLNFFIREDVLYSPKHNGFIVQGNGKTTGIMELGNIISAVANKSHSLHIMNIWDLTIFQLWDCFSRLSNNSIYDIQSMSVAAWGDKDNHFDPTAWFQTINR